MTDDGQRPGSLHSSLHSDRKRQLDYERITFLYGSAGTGLLGLALCCVFMALIIGELYSPTVAAIWALLVIVTYLPRVVLWARFAAKERRGEITLENVTPWELRAAFASIAPYICYVSAAFLPYGENTEIALLFFAVLAVLLIGGGALLYSTSLWVLLIFLHTSFAAIVARCVWEGGYVLSILAVTLVVSYFILLRVILRTHRTIVDSIKLKIDNAHRSFVDPLTRLWNRRRLDLFVEMLVPASRRSRRPFSVVLLDVDHFKEFNDSRGHQAGDDLLISVARVIQDCARDQDLVVRYGGEEFLVVLPSTSSEEAGVLAERILDRVRETTDVTISAGVEEYRSDADFEHMVELADQALYAAKQAGRDSVRIAGHLHRAT